MSIWGIKEENHELIGMRMSGIHEFIPEALRVMALIPLFWFIAFEEIEKKPWSNRLLWEVRMDRRLEYWRKA
jgi:hypothetical protein